MNLKIRVVTGVCIASLASCANTPAEPNRLSMPAPTSADNSLSSRLFRDVNAYRRSQSGKDLQRHSGLDKLAQGHSEYLLKNRGSFSLNGKNVSHFRFEGRYLVARERFQMPSVSENVGASPIPQDLLQLWKASKDHNKNMLDDWTHSGIGVAVDSDGMIFATQLFSLYNSSHHSRQERFNHF
jgi:uncharacterized protein YkwD